jgi:drug/metabolite transporter (DMT)-like permease
MFPAVSPRHLTAFLQMWTLFTAALARGNSTTQVSIMNTSTNFVLTAFLGFAIFSEALPPLWWLGAAMLVAGNVIIGRKDEGKSEEKGETGGADETARAVPGYGTGEGSAGSGLGEPANAVSSPGEDFKDGDVPGLETRSR